MRNIADMTVYTPQGQLSLVVEVKNKRGTSREWTAKMRRNILAHGELPSSKLFLLALPDHFYVWKDAATLPAESIPTYDINPEPFLRPYYEKAGIASDIVSRESFELIVSSWLNELQLTEHPPAHIPHDTQQWLLESGVLGAIHDGRITSEVPA